MIAYPWKPQTKQYGQSMAYIPWVPPQDPSTGESQGPIKQTKLQWRRSSGRPPPESLKKKIQIRDERFFFFTDLHDLELIFYLINVGDFGRFFFLWDKMLGKYNTSPNSKGNPHFPLKKLHFGIPGR